MLSFRCKFDFGNNQSGIFSLEYIYLPNQSLPWHQMARFCDDMSSATGQELFGVIEGNGILKLQSAECRLARFYRQGRVLFVDDAYTNGKAVIASQIALAYSFRPGHKLAPVVAAGQELALDLDCHRKLRYASASWTFCQKSQRQLMTQLLSFINETCRGKASAPATSPQTSIGEGFETAWLFQRHRYGLPDRFLHGNYRRERQSRDHRSLL